MLIAKSLLNKLAFPDFDIFTRIVEQIVGTIRDGEVERIKNNLDTYLYFRAPMNRRFSLECEDHVQFLSDLLKAAENHWSVQLEYPRSSEHVVRTVNPLGLWFGHNAWYLAAWDQKRKAYRTFAVDRIRSLKLFPNQPFIPPQDFNLAQWVETSWIAMPADNQDGLEEVKLAFDYETGLDIAQSFWHQSQDFDIPKKEDEPVVATFFLSKTSLETEFLGWIRSFGPKVTVLSPQWLKERGKKNA